MSNSKIQKYKINKVVIDAGHGGHDPGALGNIFKEKTITLDISLELGKMISENMHKIKIIYTRCKDEFIELHERAKVSNKNNADLFISIHCNASKRKNAHGAETYTMSIKNVTANSAVAKRENSVILLEGNYEDNYQGFDPNSPESHILFSMYQNAYHDNSLKFAQKIQQKFKSYGRKCRGVKQEGFLVLWKTAAPSVLIEVGFITNSKEEKYLASAAGKKAIAQSIFSALKEYIDEIEH